MSKRFKYEYKNLSYTIFSAFFEHFLILLIPKPENNMMAMHMYDSDTECMKVERGRDKTGFEHCTNSCTSYPDEKKTLSYI